MGTMEMIYLFCAGVGGTFLVAQFVLGLVGLGDDAMSEVDVDGDGHIDGYGAGDGWFVGVLSIRALTGLVTFFGLGGLAGWAAGMEPVTAFVIALACGLAAMYLVAIMIRWLRGLQSEGTLRIKNAIGKPGTVYLPIPRSNTGQGKVTVVVQNRSVEFAAMTPHPDALPTGCSILVTAVINSGTVEVIPESPKPESPNA